MKNENAPGVWRYVMANAVLIQNHDGTLILAGVADDTDIAVYCSNTTNVLLFLAYGMPVQAFAFYSHIYDMNLSVG